jgi:hypothetical protein
MLLAEGGMRFRGDKANVLMASILAALAVILVAMIVYYLIFAPK